MSNPIDPTVSSKENTYLNLSGLQAFYDELPSKLTVDSAKSASSAEVAANAQKLGGTSASNVLNSAKSGAAASAWVTAHSGDYLKTSYSSDSNATFAGTANSANYATNAGTASYATSAGAAPVAPHDHEYTVNANGTALSIKNNIGLKPSGNNIKYYVSGNDIYISAKDTTYTTSNFITADHLSNIQTASGYAKDWNDNKNNVMNSAKSGAEASAWITAHKDDYLKTSYSSDTTATFAGTANSANYALSAGSAASAAKLTNTAIKVNSAISADYATKAGSASSAAKLTDTNIKVASATSADYATKAGSATSASVLTNTAIKVASATSADFATNAGSATSASVLTNKNIKVSSATSADYATLAGSASKAAELTNTAIKVASATSADYAKKAGSATKLTAAKNIAASGDGTWSVSFDGSTGVTGNLQITNVDWDAISSHTATVDSATTNKFTTPKAVNDAITAALNTKASFIGPAASLSDFTTPYDKTAIYLVGPIGTGTDKYNEYVVTGTAGTTADFLLIGDTSTDLSDYHKTADFNTWTAARFDGNSAKWAKSATSATSANVLTNTAIKVKSATSADYATNAGTANYATSAGAAPFISHDHGYKISAGTTAFNVSSNIQLSAGTNIGLVSAGTNVIGITAKDTTPNNKTITITSGDSPATGSFTLNQNSDKTITLGTMAFKASGDFAPASHDHNYKLSGAGTALNISAGINLKPNGNIAITTAANTINISAKDTTYTSLNNINTAQYAALTGVSGVKDIKNYAAISAASGTTSKGSFAPSNSADTFTFIAGNNIDFVSGANSLTISSKTYTIPTVNNKTIKITTGDSPATGQFSTNTAADKTITLGSMALAQTSSYSETGHNHNMTALDGTATFFSGTTAAPSALTALTAKYAVSAGAAPVASHNHAYTISAKTTAFNVSAGIQLSAGSNINITSAGTKTIGISAKDTTYTSLNGINSTEYEALTSTSANSRNPNAHQLSSHTNFASYFDGTSALSALTSKSALSAGSAAKAASATSALTAGSADKVRLISLDNASNYQVILGATGTQNLYYDSDLKIQYNTSSNTFYSPNISSTNITATTFSGNLSGSARSALTANYAVSAGAAPVASHNHGTLQSNFTKLLVNDSSVSTWSGQFGVLNDGYWLYTVRGQQNTPSWFAPNFAAGIAFGGYDTKGVISVQYDSPKIKIAGGNGKTSAGAPVWWIGLNATKDKTYTFPGNDATLAATTGTYTATTQMKVYSAVTAGSASYAVSAGAAPVASHTIASHSDVSDYFSSKSALSALTSKSALSAGSAAKAASATSALTAGLAQTVTMSEWTANSARPITFSHPSANADSLGYDSVFTFNPSSHILNVPYITATTVSANLSGNANYARHLKALSITTPDGSAHYYKLTTITFGSQATPVTFIFGSRDSGDNNGEGLLVIRNDNYQGTGNVDQVYLLTNRNLSLEFKTSHTTDNTEVYVKVGAWGSIYYSLLNSYNAVAFNNTEVTKEVYDAVPTTVPVYRYSLTNHNHYLSALNGTGTYFSGTTAAPSALSALTSKSALSAGSAKNAATASYATSAGAAPVASHNHGYKISANTTGFDISGNIQLSAGTNIGLTSAGVNVIGITAKDTTYTTLNSINSTEYNALTSTSANSRNPNAHQLSSHTNFSTYFDGTSANSALTSKSALSAGSAAKAAALSNTAYKVASATSATNADRWTTMRNIAASGDITWSVSTNGSAGVTGKATVNSVPSTAISSVPASAIPALSWSAISGLTASGDQTNKIITPSAVDAKIAAAMTTKASFKGPYTARSAIPAADLDKLSIFLVGPTGVSPDQYEEWILTGTTTAQMLQIGDTTTDLSDYAKKNGSYTTLSAGYATATNTAIKVNSAGTADKVQMQAKSDNTWYQSLFASTSTSSIWYDSDAKVQYNPSSNTFSATNLYGTTVKGPTISGTTVYGNTISAGKLTGTQFILVSASATSTAVTAGNATDINALDNPKLGFWNSAANQKGYIIWSDYNTANGWAAGETAFFGGTAISDGFVVTSDQMNSILITKNLSASNLKAPKLSATNLSATNITGTLEGAARRLSKRSISFSRTVAQGGDGKKWCRIAAISRPNFTTASEWGSSEAELNIYTKSYGGDNLVDRGKIVLYCRWGHASASTPTYSMKNNATKGARWLYWKPVGASTSVSADSAVSAYTPFNGLKNVDIKIVANDTSVEWWLYNDVWDTALEITESYSNNISLYGKDSAKTLGDFKTYIEDGRGQWDDVYGDGTYINYALSAKAAPVESHTISSHSDSANFFSGNSARSACSARSAQSANSAASAYNGRWSKADDNLDLARPLGMAFSDASASWDAGNEFYRNTVYDKDITFNPKTNTLKVPILSATTVSANLSGNATSAKNAGTATYATSAGAAPVASHDHNYTISAGSNPF